MPRIINFHNAKIDNFRDFGGYLTIDGHKVKEGIFYRSGELAHATSYEDQTILQSLQIQTVIDLRSKQEREALPDIRMGNEKRLEISAMKDKNGHDIDFSPKHMRKLLHNGKERRKDHLSIESYFIHKQLECLLFHNPAFQAMFNVLLKGEVPLLIHCSAGKDRTGIGAALLLLALGVEKEIVLADYCFTNICRKKQIDAYLQKHSLAMRLLPFRDTIWRMSQGVVAETMLSAFAMIEERYQSMEAFFEQEYQLTQKDIAVLQSLYLEP